MGLLSELEGAGEEWLHGELERRLQERLDGYRPECGGCKLRMERHHSYSRSIVSRHGELSLRIPVFRCGRCGGMASGAGLIGEEEGRRRFSKACARRP